MISLSTGAIFAIALSNAPAVRGCTGHSARLITLENDSLGIRRARRSLSYASKSMEIVFVAMHACIRVCVS